MSEADLRKDEIMPRTKLMQLVRKASVTRPGSYATEINQQPVPAGSIVLDVSL